MKILRLAARLFVLLAAVSLTGGLIAVIGVTVGYNYYAPQLPDTQALREIQLQVPLRVYSQSGSLIGEYGAERRVPLSYGQLPERLLQGFLAAEDDRFYDHPGVDYQGIIRAVINLVKTGERSQGGSTITMQLARNLFLSSEKSYERKIKEILLALRIEQEFTKPEIFELYLNKIYLGHRSYGIGAAAQVYYGRSVDELSLPEMAMLAGLPKAPSRYNPISDPNRATTRRNYVLRRMHELAFISDAEFAEAKEQPITARIVPVPVDLEADYVAETVRAELVGRYGEVAYTEGLKVKTTLLDNPQRAANQALRRALLAYDRRHGYRGPESRIEMELVERLNAADAVELQKLTQRLERFLEQRPRGGSALPAIVLSIGDAIEVEVGKKKKRKVLSQPISLYAKGIGLLTIPADSSAWLTDDERATLNPGAVVRIYDDGDAAEQPHWMLTQLPEVQGALVALDPETGAIRAMVGGYDYFLSKYNRASQAQRQPGSSFKPFLYSTGLDAGFTTASIINDAPVVFDDPALEDTWRPENYSGKVYGPTRLRVALTHSRNLVSIRLLGQLGIGRTRRYIEKFGFDIDRIPRDLSLSLGSGTYSPLEMARGYAVFANGGFLVEPWVIQEIRDLNDEVLFTENPAIACLPCERERELALEQATEVASAELPSVSDTAGIQLDAEEISAEEAPAPKYAPRVIDQRNAWLMKSMMQDVIQRGTARAARKLGRKDIAGKTGTTNDQKDAWFTGFSQQVVAVSWIGFDRLHPLGDRETGGRAALPMWIDFMKATKDDFPMARRARPAGLVSVRINPENGKQAVMGTQDSIFELFLEENLPEQDQPTWAPESTGEIDPYASESDELF